VNQELDSMFSQSQEAEQKFYRVKSRSDYLLQEVASLKSQMDKEKGSHAALIHGMEVKTKSLEVFKDLIGILSEKGMSRLKDLVTYGLTTIFDDSQYELDIEVAERGSLKTAELYLKDGATGIRAPLNGSVGGGIQVIVSMILRVYFILSFNLRRVLIFDEAFANLSEEYVDGLFKFLSYLSKELGFRVLMVSHDPRFLPYADKTYSVSAGKVTLKS
jgi:DNA repair exonuclease SbcCD ATPase subunit